MIMKQLFRHTTSLLRTALLLGAVALFNIPTQAQTMPDAFTTMDPTTIIGDGKWYYIQFYMGDVRCYLADRGVGNIMHSKDFLPFAKDIQWTLIDAESGKFKLKSRMDDPHYVYYDGTYFKITSDESEASLLTIRKQSSGDGYEIHVDGDADNAMRNFGSSSNVWGDIDKVQKNNARACLRIAELKADVAYIIYFQDPVYKSGQAAPVDCNQDSRSGAAGFAQRHYLTYSGSGPESWTSVITNGNMSGTDVSCFRTNGDIAVPITDGVGVNSSRGIKIQSAAGQTNEWDTQFFIRSSESFVADKIIHVEFDYKADKTATVQTQAHGEPGYYHHYQMIGDEDSKLYFTTSWQHFSADITVSNYMYTHGNTDGDTDGFRTIAFNLGRTGDQETTTFYFDNIVFSTQPNRFEDADVSSRSSILNTYDDWNKLAAEAANYHKDGLWTLEETSAGSGHFYIKKYGTSDYVKTTGTTAGPLRYTLNSSNASTEFVLDASDALRFTKIKNVGSNNFMNYAGTQLSTYDYDADGWYVLDYGDANNTWKAGFLPVEVPDQDEFYRVLLGVKRDRRTDSRIKLTRESDSQGSVTVEPLSGSTMTDLYGAKFTVTSNNATNVFQIKNLPKGCYDGITIEFGSAIPAGYNIHTYGGQWEFTELQAGITSYTIDLSSGGSVIDDFSIFTLSQPSGPITISACYFTYQSEQVAEPDCGINEMLNYDGKTSAYSVQPGERILWVLEQVGDYQHFRLKTPDGRYYQDVGQMTNDADQAAVFTNESLFEYFDVKWFYVDPALSQQEIDVSDKKVTHKMSYLRDYADDYPNVDLAKQGLPSDEVSYWKNEDGTQKTNHFEITHYVKKGERLKVEFPTILNNSGDHNYYQRWYKYGESEDNMDLDNLKNHISLDTEDNGTVQYYLYKNGIVTGERIYWETNLTTLKRHAQRNFYYTNSDGQPFTVAADVSRYSDYTYENPDAPLSRNLEEPSLTMRYLFHMKDAKEMAADLSQNKYKWTNDADVNEDHWKETKTFHFPSKQVAYDNNKWVGYRGEFIGLRHVFSDYWVFDGSGTDDANLINAVNDGNASGKIEVKIYDPNGTKIRLGGWNPILAANHDGSLKFTDNDVYSDDDDKNFEGFYFYDKMYRFVKTQYGDSRFVVFRYPKGSDNKTTEVSVTGKEVYIHVYFKVNETTKYQLAQFTLIFDKDSETLPWTSVNESAQVQGTDRDPDKLREMAGNPIAKITFDYPYTTAEPNVHTYHYPTKGSTLHDQVERDPSVTPTITNSSPLPLTFDNTNYSFDGDGANWGSYAMVSQKRTTWGNDKLILPADSTGGYNLSADKYMKKAFLYIDASEQPGDICAVDFQGEFCVGDKLICTGWISGSNRYNDDGDYRCPGGITLTVKGERIEDGEKETIYRYCPGQCYELDNGGVGIDGAGYTQKLDEDENPVVDNEGNPVMVKAGDQVIWQQFYFVFGTTKKYKKYWMEVNNNCVSSNGGDFMLDNVEVFALVPEVIPEMNTPVCVNKDATDMRLLKINVGFDKILAATGETEVTTGTGRDMRIAFVFLEKDKFLTSFQTELKNLNPSVVKTIAELETIIETGEWGDKVDTGQPYADAYQAAFNAAKLGDITKVWDSNSPNDNTDSGILNFHWSTKFSDMESYSFTNALNRSGAVFTETDPETEERFIVMNGNYPNGLKWKVNTDYYIVPFNNVGIDLDELYDDFNIFSACSKKKVFQIKPPFEILSMDTSDETQEYEVCEGKIPTVLTDLSGMDINGKLVPLKDLNFDWWLGDPTIDPDTHEPKLLATLDNYHAQVSSKGVRLDEALSALRAYYPGITSLDGIIRHLNKTPNLTVDMIEYLQDLVDKGQLILHQKSINIPAQKVSDENPYCYFVACPIHDGDFEIALNHEGRRDVAYFCDEPQGLSLKIGEKAPILKCGFVSGENGFTSYAYPTDSDPVLSIRLAKKAQFKVVQHGEKTEEPMLPENYADLKYLWLPIRNASTTVERASDYNVYLASTDDPTGDKSIYSEMKRTGALPIVGKIVKLLAKKEDPNGYNRLCVYFTSNFEVCEGYTYTLSLPFKEAGDANTCDGTLLLNLKIVPDYEVWTGAAGNTDWNNDQNWRRADGNLRASIDEPTTSSPLNNNELYRTNNLPSSSPLADYDTNSSNYRTAKDRLLRKGFAPLYCTHVLIKNNEWGDAPVLYDALDGKDDLTSYPFPNLRDKDGWNVTSEVVEPATATATAILRFDMQARSFDKWKDVYGGNPDKGRSGDLIAEMYQVNSCDEIAFQAGAEMLNAHLLNYNNAWMEYQLDNRRWYLMGSALQGTISGEWYAPKMTAQQKTTYYEPVTFNANDYDRYNPAIYQRSWDKAKAILYEVGSTYSTDDNQDDLVDGGSASQGAWNGVDWNANGADAYLDRLGYKPMAGKKANVAIKGIWSNTYNDATVDYGKGGFSVMVMNHLKGTDKDQSDDVTVVRLPKEDLIYKYWSFDQTVSGTDTNLSDVQSELDRAKNRGRLKTDQLLPAYTQKEETGTKYNPVSGDDAHYGYGDRTITRIPTQKGNNALPLTLQPILEEVSAGASNLGFYLVENPFPCGLNMKEFFKENTGLKKKYWLLTTGTGQNPRQQLVQQDLDGEWITSDGTTYNFETSEAVVAPGQGFFVWATTAGEATTISFTAAMQAQTRFGKKDKENGTPYTIVVGTRQKTQPMVDGQGNPVYVQELDENGNPKTDGQGNPIYVQELDIDGNPVIDEVTGQPKLLQAEEPVVDSDGNPVIEDITDKVIIYSYKKDSSKPVYELKTRGTDSDLLGLVITAERDNYESSALVMQRDGASNDFLPEEDTEVFINSDLVNAPTVYTLCGRLATTINTVRDFRSLPLGVESTSDAPCTLTFRGVEMLGDSISFYDAVEQKLTPLESGMTFKVSGQTQNRYYLVRSLNKKDAAEETHLQIFTEGLKAKVIASTAEPITVVRCFDTGGRLIYTASPQLPEYSFDLPRAGVYIIEAETEHDRKTRKVIVK